MICFPDIRLTDRVDSACFRIFRFVPRPFKRNILLQSTAKQANAKKGFELESSR